MSKILNIRRAGPILSIMLWVIFAAMAAGMAFQTLYAENGGFVAASLILPEPTASEQAKASESGAALDAMAIRARMLDNQVKRLTQQVSSLQRQNVQLQTRQDAELERIAKIEDAFDSITASIAPPANQPVSETRMARVDSGMPLPAIKPREIPGDLSQQFVPLPVGTKTMMETAPENDPPVLPGMEDIANAEPAGDVVQTDFAITVARGNDIDVLIQSWLELQENHAASLSGLETRIKLEKTAESGVELVLVAGPLRNASDAASLCFKIETFDKGCRPIVFSGDRLPQFLP